MTIARSTAQAGPVTAEWITLTNSRGTQIRVLSYGATVTHWIIREPTTGSPIDVVLGFDDLEAYLNDNPNYVGCTVGRVANRIAGGKFELDGNQYSLAINNGPNALHGGVVGFDKKLWSVVAVSDAAAGPSATLRLVSHDGEEGYPGELQVTATFLLTNDDELRVTLDATTDKATLANLTHHGYFNLSGLRSPSVLSHVLQIDADEYVEIDTNGTPSGRLLPVSQNPKEAVDTVDGGKNQFSTSSSSSAMDFRNPIAIGERISALAAWRGYDHAYALNKRSSAPEKAESQRAAVEQGSYPSSSSASQSSSADSLPVSVVAHEPSTGLVLEMGTTSPSVQLYTGNWLDGMKLKEAHRHGSDAAVCARHAGL